MSRAWLNALDSTSTCEAVTPSPTTLMVGSDPGSRTATSEWAIPEVVERAPRTAGGRPAAAVGASREGLASLGPPPHHPARSPDEPGQPQPPQQLRPGRASRERGPPGDAVGVRRGAARPAREDDRCDHRDERPPRQRPRARGPAMSSAWVTIVPCAVVAAGGAGIVEDVLLEPDVARDQQRGEEVQQPAALLEPAGEDLDQGVGDDAERDAVRDRVRERHRHDREERRHTRGDVAPVDPLDTP